MNDKLPFKILIVHGNAENKYEIIPHAEVENSQSEMDAKKSLVDKELQSMCLSFVFCCNIVIVDTTPYPLDIKGEGNSILVMFPKNITEAHLQTMENVMPFFKNVNKYRIWYDFERIDGKIKCQCLEENSINVVKSYLGNYQNGKTK